MPRNFNDLRLNADVKLEAHPLAAKEDAQLHSGERGGAAPRLSTARRRACWPPSPDSARPEATRTRFACPERPRGGDQIGGSARSRPRHRGIPLARRSLRPQQRRSQDRFRRLTAGRRRLLLLGGARRSAARALRSRCRQPASGLLYFKTALEAAGQSAFDIHAGHPDQTANLAPSKYAFVVLSDVGALPGGFENELRDYVRGGGSVLIALGHNSMAGGKVPVTGQKIVRIALLRPRRRPLPDRRLARPLAPFHSKGQRLGRREISTRHQGRARQRARRRATLAIRPRC